MAGIVGCCFSGTLSFLLLLQAKEKQVQRIRSLFHRQLSVPLADMSSTLAAYKAWEAEQRNIEDVETIDLVDIYPHVASSYQKALEMYNVRFHHEEQILSLNVSDSEKLQHYMVCFQVKTWLFTC